MGKLSSQNLKFFFIGFVFSLPLFWGTNVFQKEMEDFLFWENMTNNPQILTAQISQDLQLEQLKPIRNWQIPNLEVNANSAISVLVKPGGSQKILFEKEKDRVLPIASLTKLMTANIVLEYYDLDREIQISKKAASQPAIGLEELKMGENFRAQDLLYSTLIESNNRAAYALAEVIGESAFLDIMDLETENLGLENTYFANPAGLDPEGPEAPINYSTSRELAKLVSHLLETKPEILKISALPEFNLFLTTGVFHHKIKNTNELLTKIPSIVGGKTGETLRAGGCLLLVLESPRGKGYLINVILGSDNRFEEMKKLVDWLNLAYKW